MGPPSRTPAPEPPLVSVVVPSRNRAERLEGLLRSLRAQTLPRERFEVVVVDDASADRTQDVLRAELDRGDLRLAAIRNERRGGPAVARNRGWRRAQAPLVAFIDDDCEATPSWLEGLVRAADAHPGEVIQGPTTPIPREAAMLGPLSLTRSIEELSPWFETCNILYPRELLERLGGFDERFPDALGEDTDLGWRARELGAPARFAAGALVHHAVEHVGPAGVLARALRGPDAVYVFRRHPGLRAQTLRLGVFRNPALMRLVPALLALAATDRTLVRAGCSAPYLLSVVGRCRAQGGRLRHLPLYVVQDVCFAATSIRGSLRHRTLVL